MVREKWIVGVRNTLSDLAMQCNSAAAIDKAKMTCTERNTLESLIIKARDWIDKKIKV